MYQVFNIIPSISAITGISPQRYFWRICIAIHIGPRFVIAACYRSRYTYLLARQTDIVAQAAGAKLINIVFWLHIVEISALCGVTYVSNRENYREFRPPRGSAQIIIYFCHCFFQPFTRKYSLSSCHVH